MLNVQRTIHLCLVLLLSSIEMVCAQEDTYPTGERLFHIERSKNRNLVCYDVNLDNGELNTRKPLEVYWINREDEPGARKGLTAIQNRFAYGYKVVKQGDEESEVVLKAYPDRSLTIRAIDGRYVCTIQIANRTALLQRLYVKASESNSLQVEYVELYGLDQESGQQLTERVSQ